MRSSTMLPQPPAVTLLSCFCELMPFSAQILVCTHISQHRIFHKKEKKRRKRGATCFLLPLISLFYLSAKAMNQHYIALGTAQIEQKIFPPSQIYYNLSLEGKWQRMLKYPGGQNYKQLQINSVPNFLQFSLSSHLRRKTLPLPTVITLN